MQALKTVTAIALFYGLANLTVWAVSMIALGFGFDVEAGALQGLLPLFHGQRFP